MSALVLLLSSIFNSGCVYIPTGEVAHNGTDLRRNFTARPSKGSVVPGASTRADVARALGVDAKYNPDGPTAPAWVMCDPNCRGYLLKIDYLPAGPASSRDYFARVEFDERDVVRSFELRRDRDWNDAGMGMMVGERKWLRSADWPKIKTQTEPVASAPP